MRRYRIEYRDPDPGCPIFVAIVKAYNTEHALERFRDDGDDWLVIDIKRA